jgi:hypothetical protein
MKNATRAARIVFRVTGVIELLLGIVLWTGHGLSLVPVHMVIGIAFVLALWALAALGARAGAPAGLVALAWVWGFVVPVLGMTQMRLLPGDWHWVIRLVHLLVGIAAMAIGDRVARTTGAGPRRWRPRQPAVVGWPEGGGL